MRTNEKRRLRKRAQKASLKTRLRTVRALIAANDLAGAERVAPTTFGLIGKMRQKRVINRKRAARLQSRLQRSMNKLVPPASPEKPA